MSNHKFNTNFTFDAGKLTIVLDGQAGSSGKGALGSFLCQYANNWQFACNAFTAQAGHTVIVGKDRYFYQTFNSCSYQTGKFEKVYVGPGAAIEMPALLREIEENRLTPKTLGISPLVAVIAEKDVLYERGIVDFEGNPVAQRHDGTMRNGSTAHGVGACRARRTLRRQDVRLMRDAVKDLPGLAEFLCDVPAEIMGRLRHGQAGMLEVAQGFQLSLLGDFYPNVTSRNCSVAAALDDMMLPPVAAGKVWINLRTYPIRISSHKYLDKTSGQHLTWADVVSRKQAGTFDATVEVFVGDSGPGYDDQLEVSWDDVAAAGGHTADLTELTSVTKLPRRVFTFSHKNLHAALIHNDTGHQQYLSVNFANYVDANLQSSRGTASLADHLAKSDRLTCWVNQYIPETLKPKLAVFGTGPDVDDKLLVCR